MAFFSHRAKALMTVSGSFILALSLGNFYTLGNLSPYLTSYLRLRVDPKFTDSYMIWINGFFMLGDGLLMPLGGYLAPKVGSRIVMSVGCVIFTGISALSAYTISKGFIQFCVTYGFLSWVGAGIMSSIAIGEVMKWFPARKGLVSGIVVSGFGFGGFGLNAFQTYIINPDNLSTDKSGPYQGYFSDQALLDRVPKVFWTTALIMAAFQVVGLILLFTPPINQPDEEKSNDRNNSSFNVSSDSATLHADKSNESVQVSGISSTEHLAAAAAAAESDYGQRDGLHPSKMIKTREFYLIWIIFACQMMPVSFLLTYYKNYGLTFITDDRFLSTIGAIGSIISCIGKVAFGIVLDKTSYKTALAILSLGIGVTVELLYFAQYLGYNSYGVKWYFSIVFFCGYVIVGGIYGIIAGVSGAAFGIRYAGANFGVLFSSQALGSFGGAFLVQTIQSHLVWRWTSFTSVVLFSVTSLFFCVLLKKKD